MILALDELSVDAVVGFNRSAIAEDRRKNPQSKQVHHLARPQDLASCLGGIFFPSGGVQPGYVHLPIENMAGLLLHRIAQGQFFMDGNKRTGVLSCYAFLHNNGYGLRVDKGKLNDLIWGFAPDPNDPNKMGPKYKDSDAVSYIYDNIYVRK